MNFDDAIMAHTEWKMKLARYIKKPDGSYKADAVSQDNQCALGKWIYSDGKNQFGTLPEYERLKGEHAKFHQRAGEIIRKADSGAVVGEDELSVTSDYGKISTTVINAIRALRTKVGQ